MKRYANARRYAGSRGVRGRIHERDGRLREPAEYEYVVPVDRVV